MENMSSSDGDSSGSGLPSDLASCRWWTSIPSPLLFVPATTVPDRSLPLRSVVDLHSGLRCVGSSGGWLAVADSACAIRLVNALTLQVAAWLPPLPRSTEVRRLQALGLVRPRLASRAPDDAIPGGEHAIHKVAFAVEPPAASGTSYAHSAAALHRSPWTGKGLALTFTRAGWRHWEWRRPAFFGDGEDEHFDVAYCQRSGVYYVATPPGLVWVLDISAPVPTVEPLARCHQSFRELAVAQSRHVIVLSGDGAIPQLYVVVVTEWGEQRRAIVQRYTAGEPWSVVSDLGGRALLIASHAQSVAVMPTAASPWWMKPDCIYWITRNGCAYDDWEVEQWITPVWRFHVPTGTTDMFVPAQL